MTKNEHSIPPSLNDVVTNMLIGQGVDFVHFVDVSKLSSEQSKGYPYAILFGILLSSGYVQMLYNTPNYVQKRIEDNIGFDDDELYVGEMKTGRLSDELMEYLKSEGYSAYSHSDENQVATGFFDGVYGKTPLPHKTIAVLAGLGWVGKNNLLVTEEWGSALCLGVVLTNAPIENAIYNPMLPQCGDCSICVDACDVKALTGHTWNLETTREDMIDVHTCNTCNQCLSACPWTRKSVNSLF